ncbi:hypothetical protein NA57DRAFT_55281 [Rhizodiscina lignyota]|uniref:Uncharacterized protein n=1 Tax=Rhizodiscina lignyota TaxID=1504668 RepID=A0A9P4MB28_9PEZI|nr:hypothetical protein NA57DRAFT_55281 [Rhizodiscina lignyota]
MAKSSSLKRKASRQLTKDEDASEVLDSIDLQTLEELGLFSDDDDYDDDDDEEDEEDAEAEEEEEPEAEDGDYAWLSDEEDDPALAEFISEDASLSQVAIDSLLETYFEVIPIYNQKILGGTSLWTKEELLAIPKSRIPRTDNRKGRL